MEEDPSPQVASDTAKRSLKPRHGASRPIPMSGWFGQRPGRHGKLDQGNEPAILESTNEPFQTIIAHAANRTISRV